MTLQQALENNPAETLRILQSQYAQPEPEAEPDWTDDPTDQRFRELDQRLSHWEQQQASAELRQAVGVLQQRYGEEFDAREVVSRASAMGRMDLEAVYKEMAFDRYWQGQQEARKTQAGGGSRPGQRQDRSRLHPSGQRSEQHRGTGDRFVPHHREAFAEAKRQLGWT